MSRELRAIVRVMLRVVDYRDVLAQMESQHLRCLYHNSGSWGFASDVTTYPIGWIGPTDTTIRSEAMKFTHSVPQPYETNLSNLAIDLWRERLMGPLWVMPKSHWSYELQFGSREWLPEVLRQVGADPDSLIAYNNAAALEFAEAEATAASHFLNRLLEMLHGSDFALVFPGHSILCTLHHHKQLWWVTTDRELAARIQAMPRLLRP